MPAPARPAPVKIVPESTRFTNGIVGHYSAAEIDALLAGISGGDSAITVHDGPVPQPQAPIPQALEDAFAALSEGLHYFKDAGSLVAITRQEYQTTITITGPTKSVVKIVKSAAGLPTPENPSMLVQQEADGKWMKLTSDELNKPFGPPQMVDLFSLNGGDPATVDLSNYYVKEDVNALIAGLAARIDPDQVLVADSVYSGSFNFGAFPLPDAQLKYLDDGEGNGERLSVTDRATGTSKYVAYLSDIVAPTPADLSPYAKLTDNTQNIVSNAVVAKGYAFGDSTSGNNPGLVYTDTNEGYGPRLVLDTPAGVELIPYQSDFAPIRSRLDALESKSAPVSGETGDLSGYAKLTDANQTIVSSVVQANRYRFDDTRSLVLLVSNGAERPVYRDGVKNNALAFVSELAAYCTILDAADRFNLCAKKADTYTKTECDTKFLTLVDLGVVVQKGELPVALAPYALKTDLAPYATTTVVNAAMNSFATRAYVDEKFTSVNPTGAVTINDPGLAAFKQSVLDEVKKLMAGGKTVPADVAWTKLLNAGTAANAPEAKVLNGIVYMRGEAVKQGGAGYTANAYQLPPTIPAPPREMVVPLAMKNTNPSGRYYGYATIQTNRQIGVSCDNSFNTVWFDGISYPAYE